MTSRLALTALLTWPIYGVLLFIMMSSVFSTTAFVGSFSIALPIIGVGALIAAISIAYMLTWTLQLVRSDNATATAATAGR